jgi:hypothetical protein
MFSNLNLVNLTLKTFNFHFSITTVQTKTKFEFLRYRKWCFIADYSLFSCTNSLLSIANSLLSIANSLLPDRPAIEWNIRLASFAVCYLSQSILLHFSITTVQTKTKFEFLWYRKWCFIADYSLFSCTNSLLSIANSLLSIANSLLSIANSLLPDRQAIEWNIRLASFAVCYLSPSVIFRCLLSFAVCYLSLSVIFRCLSCCISLSQQSKLRPSLNFCDTVNDVLLLITYF